MSETEGNHVGPIIFSNEIARGQLEEEGKVVTFRSSERTCGYTWWRKSRTGPKEGDVLVRKLGPVSTREKFEKYVDMSGFDSVEHWHETIRDLHGCEPEGFLYTAEVIDDE